MGKVSIRSTDDLEWAPSLDASDPAVVAKYGPGEISSLRAPYFPNGGEELELFGARLEPDAEIRPHAHDSAEIILVTEGEIRVGARVCRAGTAIYVDAHTLYGFRAGPDGATFLNFRPRPGTRTLTKQELRESLRAARSASGSAQQVEGMPS